MFNIVNHISESVGLFNVKCNVNKVICDVECRVIFDTVEILN